MAKITVQVSVEKSAYDMGKQAAMLIKAFLDKRSLTEIAAQELVQMGAISDDIANFKLDLAEDKIAFYEGLALGLKDGYLPPAAV